MRLDVVDNNNILLNESYIILLDDSIKEIKTKIFLNNTNTKDIIKYYPNLCKLELVYDNRKIVLSKNDCLLFNYDKIPDKIRVISIFDILITNDKYKRFNLEPYYLYSVLKDSDLDDVILNLYEDLLLDFIDLDKNDLDNIIKMKMINFNKSLIKETGRGLLTSDENARLEDDIRDFFNVIANKYNSQIKKYTDETGDLFDFYQNYIKYDRNKYYNQDDFIYTTVKFIIKPQDYDGTFEGRFIKLNQVFNTLELSDDIPFIAFNDSPRRDPAVKVYNNLINRLDKDLIKSWILNENKKLGKVTYKRLRGLMIKYRFDKNIDDYITFVINENGLITVKLEFKQTENIKSIELMISKVKTSVDSIINLINNLYNVFKKSKKISNDVSIDIDSISAVLETKIRINKNKLRGMLVKSGISEFFEQKDTKDEKIVSMYYKKCSGEGDKGEEDGGITVTVKNNPFVENSSTVIIYGANSSNQLSVIADNIMILSEIQLDNNEQDESEDEYIKERKLGIKETREKGGITDPKKCQKNRQTTLDNNTGITDKTLVLEFKGNKYICKGDVYKYPGLVNGEVPCCFKKPGKGIESIIDPNILGTLVQPSNYKIKVNNGDAIFDTLVIKVTSDIENFDLSKSRYFYLDKNLDAKFPLVHIHDEQLIKTINENERNDKDEDIWLKEISLNQLITQPKTNQCINPPLLNLMNDLDINKQCEHTGNMIFGYNKNAFPCCFSKNPQVYSKTSEKTSKTIQHIITTEKILGNQRQGILPYDLNKLLNEILNQSDDTDIFLRYGVTQNKLSFLNCILESINTQSISNIFQLKRFLVNYLEENQDIFIKLNNSNISIKYTIDDYKKYILGDDIFWYDVIDLVQNVFKINILILEKIIDESDSGDYKLVCNSYIEQDLSKPYLILIKRQDTFEIIIRNSGYTWNKNDEQIKQKNINITPTVTFIFKYKIDNVVNFFVDYYKSTCVKEDRFPVEYKYDKLYSAKYLLEKLKGTSHEIRYQIVNSFNKTNILVTKSGLLVPIYEIGILDNISIKTLESIQQESIQQIQIILDDFNRYVIPKMEILGATVGGDVYTSILTNFGQMIPVKPTPISESKIDILPIKYYSDVDLYLSGKEMSKNTAVEWYKNTDMLRTIIFDIKKILGGILVNDTDLKDNIISINKSTSMSKFEKIENISNILNDIIKRNSKPQIINILKNIPDLKLQIIRANKNVIEKDEKVKNIKSIITPWYKFVLKVISNDIINDNIENLLLNNVIRTEKLDTDEIVKRNSESIWLNINDIKIWINKNK